MLVARCVVTELDSACNLTCDIPLDNKLTVGKMLFWLDSIRRNHPYKRASRLDFILIQKIFYQSESSARPVSCFIICCHSLSLDCLVQSVQQCGAELSSCSSVLPKQLVCLYCNLNLGGRMIWWLNKHCYFPEEIILKATLNTWSLKL